MPGVYRTVRIGGVTKDDLLKQLRLARVQLNTAAEELFADARFTVLEEAGSVDVIDLALEELGLPKGGTMPEIRKRPANPY